MKSIGAIFALLIGLPAFAVRLPDCSHFGESQNRINNKEILGLKRSSEEGTQAVALLKGTFVKMYSHKGRDRVFQMKIGPGNKDTVEVRNSSDDKIPALHRGDRIIACGTYRTHFTDLYQDPRSPDGAIINRTNFAWNPYDNDGFLVINGVLYNQ